MIDKRNQEVLDAEIQDSVRKATEELQHVSLKEIEQQTAITWLGRAIASYNYYGQTGILKCLLEAEGYAQEAVEHAALADLDTLKTVMKYIATVKARLPL